MFPRPQSLQNVSGGIDSSSVVLVELSKSVECGICLEVMYLPLVGKCGHSFCEPCIRRMLSGFRMCPICRGEFGALEERPPNILVKGLIQHYFPVEYERKRVQEQKGDVRDHLHGEDRSQEEEENDVPLVIRARGGQQHDDDEDWEMGNNQNQNNNNNNNNNGNLALVVERRHHRSNNNNNNVIIRNQNNQWIARGGLGGGGNVGSRAWWAQVLRQFVGFVEPVWPLLKWMLPALYPLFVFFLWFTMFKSGRARRRHAKSRFLLNE